MQILADTDPKHSIQYIQVPCKYDNVSYVCVSQYIFTLNWTNGLQMQLQIFIPNEHFTGFFPLGEGLN